MNTLDIILLVLLAVGFYFGYKKGFLHQLASILSLVLAYALTSTLTGKLHQYLIDNNILEEDSSKWISYALCFVGIILLVRILGNLVEKLLKLLGINFINKFAGGIINVLKWSIALSILVYFITDLEILKVETETLSYYLKLIGETLMQQFFD